MAYGAANIGDYTSAISSYKNPDDIIFYHDECGWWLYCTGCPPSTTAYGAVRFIPTQESQLQAVDFWAVDINMQYEIKIFDTISGGSVYTFHNQLGSTQIGSTTEMGYYSIPLNTPIPLVSGDDFILQVKLTTPDWGYPIPVDYCDDADLKWSAIAISSGESYKSCDGNQFKKFAVNGVDIGIRARAEVPNQPPQATIDSITPNPAEQVIDTVSFTGNGTDSDGTVVTYNWSSSLDGHLSNASSFTKPASELSIGTHMISFKVQDDDGAWSTEAIENLTVNPVNPTRVFDTGSGTYPRIAGVHNGTITPNQTIIVHKLYTYPCLGTGGHTEYARIWNNSGLDRIATWGGYKGDWHNITFNETFVLYKGEIYNYTLRTGSYPQIHHTTALPTANGWINCTKFTDANGKEYTDWIPAMKLY